MEENNKPNYGYIYPRPAVTADCVVFCFEPKYGGLKVLLINRGIEPFKGNLALPGGFLQIKCQTNENGLVTSETNESLMDCAKRELKEETGLKPIYMEEVGTWSTPGRDPRCITITDAYYALVMPQNIKAGDDAANAKWVPVAQVLNAIKNMPEGMHFLAFDHDDIILKAYERLGQQICFTPQVFYLLPKEFKMTQLQNLYEAILGRQFDRRNFARKIIDSDVLDIHVSSRRSVTYTFNPKKYQAFLDRGKITNLIF